MDYEKFQQNRDTKRLESPGMKLQVPLTDTIPTWYIILRSLHQAETQLLEN